MPGSATWTLLLSSHSVMSDSFFDPMDCSPPGSSVHGISQARILEWVAMPFSRGSSRPKDWTLVSWVSCIGIRVLYHYCHVIFHYQLTTEDSKELRIWKCTGEIFKIEAWPLEKKKKKKKDQKSVSPPHLQPFCFSLEMWMVVSGRRAMWTYASLLGPWHGCSPPPVNSGWMPHGGARTPHQGKGMPAFQTGKRKGSNVHFRRKLIVTRFLDHVHWTMMGKASKEILAWICISLGFSKCVFGGSPTTLASGTNSGRRWGLRAESGGGVPWVHRHLPLCCHPGIH